MHKVFSRRVKARPWRPLLGVLGLAQQNVLQTFCVHRLALAKCVFNIPGGEKYIHTSVHMKQGPYIPTWLRKTSVASERWILFCSPRSINLLWHERMWEVEFLFCFLEPLVPHQPPVSAVLAARRLAVHREATFMPVFFH